jgi:hypothetical protein
MPFTFSHPAAVLPLARPLRKWTVPSALVIGSMTPDFALFLPLGVARLQSHSLAGIFWFCLPIGLASYLVYHLYLKFPLLGLLPNPLGRRLGLIMGKTRLPNASWRKVIASLLFGILTHLAWDSFTHAGASGVEAFPLLSVEVFTFDTYHGYVYKLLQYFSSGLGLLIIGIWGFFWLRTAPPGPALDRSMTREERVKAFAALILIPFISGTITALTHFPIPFTLRGVELLLGMGAVSVFSALGAALLGYASWWHLRKTKEASRVH